MGALTRTNFGGFVGTQILSHTTWLIFILQTSASFWQKKNVVIFSTPHLPHCSPVRPCSTIHLKGWRYSRVIPTLNIMLNPSHGKEQNPETYRCLRRFGHPTLDRLRELQIIYNHPGLDRMLDNRSNILSNLMLLTGQLRCLEYFWTCRWMVEVIYPKFHVKEAGPPAPHHFAQKLIAAFCDTTSAGRDMRSTLWRSCNAWPKDICQVYHTSKYGIKQEKHLRNLIIDYIYEIWSNNRITVSKGRHALFSKVAVIGALNQFMVAGLSLWPWLGWNLLFISPSLDLEVSASVRSQHHPKKWVILIEGHASG